jgi:hypothetical protein
MRETKRGSKTQPSPRRLSPGEIEKANEAQTHYPSGKILKCKDSRPLVGPQLSRPTCRRVAFAACDDRRSFSVANDRSQPFGFFYHSPACKYCDAVSSVF